MISNIQDLCDALEVGSVARIRRTIFKSTECGCVFNNTDEGVTVCGYAEGADAECVPHALDYPFQIAEFYCALEAADQEGVELFNEWNGESDYQDTIDDDNNQRAADMNAELRGGVL